MSGGAYLCSSLMYSSCKLMYLSRFQKVQEHGRRVHLLKMSLEPLQSGVFVAIVIANAFDVDARYA